MQKSIVRFLKIAASIGSILIVSGLILVYYVQDRLIFQPEKMEEGHKLHFSFPFREVFIPTADGERLHAVLCLPADTSRGLVIYFHGNAGNLQRWGEIAGSLTLYKYHVLVADYRGYGKSTGKPTEEGLYADADAVWKWATDNMPDVKYVIYGRSLGTAVASYLAQKVQPDLLILETPFDELRSVVHPGLQPLLRLIPLKYSFPTAQYLSRVQCRRIIGHGNQDEIVPVHAALRLAPLLTDDDSLIIVDGARHNNLNEYASWQAAVGRSLVSLPD